MKSKIYYNSNCSTTKIVHLKKKEKNKTNELYCFSMNILPRKITFLTILIASFILEIFSIVTRDTERNIFMTNMLDKMETFDKSDSKRGDLVQDNVTSTPILTRTTILDTSIFNEIYIDPSDAISSDQANKCPYKKYNESIKFDTVYCNWTWDTYLCWPPTPSSSIVYQRCPKFVSTIKNRNAIRICDSNGKWMGNPEKPISQRNTNGWTNFANCFTGEVWDLLIKCHIGGECDDKYDIAERTRILEIIGLVLSFFTLLISLIIFFNFQSLRNTRTKIHKNLFIAMEVQVIIRLILYFDQKITRPNVETEHLSSSGIENTPYLCESLYFLLEYARTTMFMWMLIEGVHLHSGITWINGTRHFPYIAYAITGWGAPLIMTAIWQYFTVKYNKGEKCFFNYNLTPYYLILEGPRHAVILLNLIFLLNIIRVLVVKLRQSHSSDLDQVRKAVRAAIVLLPLLGIAHILFYFEPTDRSVVAFAIWSYSAYFFCSFQGFFIALIYCFLNGEVRTAVARGFTVYMSLGNIQRRRSMFSGAYNTAPETDVPAANSVNREQSSQTHTNCNSTRNKNRRSIFSICFRGQTLAEQTTSAAPESVVFELSEH